MTFADKINDIGTQAGQLKVRLSNQLIHLLSEQMYSSPLKAIEELVVNAYDADANECRVSFLNDDITGSLIAIFDNGQGMDFKGLEELWHVGESPKKNLSMTSKYGRRIIGKFGIGKLATYAISNRITYISRTADKLHHVSCDFTEFKSAPEGGAADPVNLIVNEVSDFSQFKTNAEFSKICESLNIDEGDLTNGKCPTWTLCVLENLKPKAQELKVGRLKWVLKTAMPLKANFSLFVNRDRVERTKEAFNPIVEFAVAELDEKRLVELNKNLTSDEKWRVESGAIVSNTFPQGLTGEVLVTSRSLVAGKSAEVDRSHGFFVFVNDRLVNQTDELFGLHALSHSTFNNFRADVKVNDLNSEVTAPREGIEQGRKLKLVKDILLDLFNDARSRKNAAERESEAKEKRKREHERSYVSPRLVEQPIADTLAVYGNSETGTDADDSWFFMSPKEHVDLPNVVESLYENGTGNYKYSYRRLGKTERLVKLDPSDSNFTLNEDHEVVQAYSDDPKSRKLLEDLVAAEVLLEVYLREAGVDPFVIGEVLERRDTLMRSLAIDQIYSLESIAELLRNSRDDEYELEIALVAATRALGFNAKHISKAGEPDGFARFNDYKTGDIKITLEAKSSGKTPSLSAIDFSGLIEHVTNNEAQGCLLLSPEYPGEKIQQKDTEGNDKNSSVENRATEGKISCWTIEDMARVVSATESRQITAVQILDIVLNKFTPKDVSKAVDELLNGSSKRELYQGILDVLKTLDKRGRLQNDPRTVETISGIIATNYDHLDVTNSEVRAALVELSNSSRGLLRLADSNTLIFTGDLEEFERRVSTLTGALGQPRKIGNFRAEDE